MLSAIISGDQTSNIRIFSGKQVRLKFAPVFREYVTYEREKFEKCGFSPILIKKLPKCANSD